MSNMLPNSNNFNPNTSGKLYRISDFTKYTCTRVHEKKRIISISTQKESSIQIVFHLTLKHITR